jgi:hypothetical protein
VRQKAGVPEGRHRAPQDEILGPHTVTRDQWKQTATRFGKLTEFTVSSNRCNVRSYGSDLIWTALADTSPGRQSWVHIRRLLPVPQGRPRITRTKSWDTYLEVSFRLKSSPARQELQLHERAGLK